MAEQHKIMREGVFKMSQAQVDVAAGSLGATSGPMDPERHKVIDEFRAKAEAAMTPDQLERLRAQYAHQVGTS